MDTFFVSLTDDYPDEEENYIVETFGIRRFYSNFVLCELEDIFEMFRRSKFRVPVSAAPAA